jgi:hypothetical protein
MALLAIRLLETGQELGKMQVHGQIAVATSGFSEGARIHTVTINP